MDHQSSQSRGLLQPVQGAGAGRKGALRLAGGDFGCQVLASKPGQLNVLNTSEAREADTFAETVELAEAGEGKGVQSVAVATCQFSSPRTTSDERNIQCKGSNEIEFLANQQEAEDVAGLFTIPGEAAFAIAPVEPPW